MTDYIWLYLYSRHTLTG